MREILFRGKRVDNGEWVEGWYGKKSFGAWPLREAITPSADAENGYLHYEEIIPETLGQYTGLTDRNGKKVFEGDIIKGENILHTDRTIHRVMYHENGFHFVDEDGVDWHPDYTPLFEIIGNIHDNPELLKGGEPNGCEQQTEGSAV